jgi:ABC-type Mn2+/Zn2+ transport system ATPase subunit
MINIEGLTVSYDKRLALSNVYLKIQEGNLYGILGPNGAGKSTFFKAILGLLKPDAGKITFNVSKADQLKRKMAYIPQKDHIDWQFPATVEDVVMMGRYPHKGVFERINKYDKLLAKNAIETLGLSAFSKQQIGSLSGGQQQRVFIARALCQEAEIYLFDEPFVGVDVTTEKTIIEVMKSLRDKKNTLLVVHHDLSKVNEYFDRVILLNQRLIAEGKTEDVMTQELLALAYGGTLPLLQKVIS